RGLTRSLSCATPVNRSQVHLTSAAVNGLPSCHLTLPRSLNVSVVCAASHDHSVARSGTTDFNPLCGTCWSYMTRLLKTPIIGPWPAMVASSWIDMLAGLSKKNPSSVPPGLGGHGGPAAAEYQRQSSDENAFPLGQSILPTLRVSS